MSAGSGRRSAEVRFDAVFEHLGAVVSYARRRGAADPEAIAAEVMAIAWRRLPDVPTGDARPWLFATARNLVFADWRKGERERRALARSAADQVEAPPAPVIELDPELELALRSLSVGDREALLLIAWEELSPAQAARSLGVSAVAFRARLHRARRRLRAAIPGAGGAPLLASPPSRRTNV